MADAGQARDRQQTQYVRINNNAFTAEDNEYVRGGGGRGTEIIPRGGAGAFHGNAELLVKDEALNARNPLAHNKPEYREHETSVDFGGPVLPGRLSATVFFSHNKAENVDTIHATTPTGLFDLGIVRPTITREVSTEGTYQLLDSHSLTYDVGVETGSRRNQNIGGFTLPERASTSESKDWNVRAAAVLGAFCRVSIRNELRNQKSADRDGAAQRCRPDQRARCVSQRRGAEPVPTSSGGTTSSAACIRVLASASR